MARSIRSGGKDSAATDESSPDPVVPDTLPVEGTGDTDRRDDPAPSEPQAAMPRGDIDGLIEPEAPTDTRRDDAAIPDAEVVLAAPDAPQAVATDTDSPQDTVPSHSEGPAPAATHQEAVRTVPSPPAPVARPSFVPMVLGGVVAAALGYAAAWTDLLPRPPDPAMTARVDALAIAQSDLATTVDALAARPVEDADARAGVAAAEAAQRQAAADHAADLEMLAAQAQVLSSETGALGERLTALENRPQVTVALSEQAQAAVEAQIAALRQEAADGIARVEEDRAALAAQADARLAALEADLRATLAAIADERAALDTAREAAAAEARATRLASAVSDLRAALDAGIPYADPLAALADLAGMPPPEALSARAADGIPSFAALREAFPEAARAALEQTLRAQVDAGEIGRIEGFMRIQSGARSLTPQDGDDADALLSRAEAALAAGDLSAALDLVARLPDPGRVAMQDWVGQTETRRAALAALAAFGDS